MNFGFGSFLAIDVSDNVVRCRPIADAEDRGVDDSQDDCSPSPQAHAIKSASGSEQGEASGDSLANFLAELRRVQLRREASRTGRVLSRI